MLNIINNRTAKAATLLVLLNIVYSYNNLVISQNRDVQLWNSALIDWNFTQGWLVELEIDYNKLLSEGPVWREFATQPSIEYYPNNSIDLFAGVYLTSTKQNDIEDTNEIRPLIGIRWNIIKPEKRVFLRTQAKFEHRFFKSLTKDNSDNVGRVRVRLDLFIPLTQKSYNDNKNLYGIIWSEAFINFDSDINEKYQSTFRQYLGLGYRFSLNWRFEVNYVFQASRDSIDDQNPDTISNVILIALKHYISKK